MRRRLGVLLVLVSLLSGCGGGQIDSIRKMTPVILLVSLVALQSLARDRRLNPTFGGRMSGSDDHRALS